MLIYQTTNPCLCNPQQVTPSTDCPEECNCLKLCHITLNRNDSNAVGPCAATGTLDVTESEYGHDTCACGENALRWSVQAYDTDVFITTSITSAGVLTWVTQGPEALEKQYGSITLKGCCGELSAYVNVIIGVKDLCNCPECEQCEDCDPCTGVCAEGDVDITIQGVDSSGTTNIT